MARRAAIGFLAVLVVFGLWRVAPWALQDRGRIAGTPSLSGLYEAHPVVLGARESACVKPVPLTGDVAEVQVLVFTGTPQPLELELSGPGYETSARAPATYVRGRETPVVFELPRRPPGELLGELCVRNAGTASVRLSGTDEPRSVVVAETTVEGERRPDMHVTFYSGERSSTVGFAGTLVDRASAMTGGLFPGPVVWLLALAFVLGVPALAFLAFVRGFDGADGDGDRLQ